MAKQRKPKAMAVTVTKRSEATMQVAGLVSTDRLRLLREREPAGFELALVAPRMPHSPGEPVA